MPKYTINDEEGISLVADPPSDGNIEYQFILKTEVLKQHWLIEALDDLQENYSYKLTFTEDGTSCYQVTGSMTKDEFYGFFMKGLDTREADDPDADKCESKDDGEGFCPGRAGSGDSQYNEDYQPSRRVHFVDLLTALKRLKSSGHQSQIVIQYQYTDTDLEKPQTTALKVRYFKTVDEWHDLYLLIVPESFPVRYTATMTGKSRVYLLLSEELEEQLYSGTIIEISDKLEAVDAPRIEPLKYEVSDGKPEEGIAYYYPLADGEFLIAAFEDIERDSPVWKELNARQIETAESTLFFFTQYDPVEEAQKKAAAQEKEKIKDSMERAFFIPLCICLIACAPFLADIIPSIEDEPLSLAEDSGLVLAVTIVTIITLFVLLARGDWKTVLVGLIAAAVTIAVFTFLYISAENPIIFAAMDRTYGAVFSSAALGSLVFLTLVTVSLGIQKIREPKSEQTGNENGDEHDNEKDGTLLSRLSLCCRRGAARDDTEKDVAQVQEEVVPSGSKPVAV